MQDRKIQSGPDAHVVYHVTDCEDVEKSSGHVGFDMDFIQLGIFWTF